MSNIRIKRSIRMSITCVAYSVIAVFILRYVAERTGVISGYEGTTGEGMIAYFLAIMLTVTGALLLVSGLYFLERNSKHPIPEWLSVVFALIMPFGIYFFSPQLPKPI